MPEIRKLPPSVVNKIAAGEVIERPASIVKELVENAVDAGARRVDVALEKGGVDLVRVVDDGHGMSADQLPLAVASHATSKIIDADDLFRVGTLGFRGEALASIAEVSHLTIRSRPHGESAGHELLVTGGHLHPIAPCGCPVGTAMEVRNLFFNTPVRRKFMRSTQTELGHATEAFTRIALAWPQVHFTLSHHGRTVHDLPATNNLRERISALFGPELAEDLLWVESGDGPYQVSGFVASPQQSRSHNRMQYLILNGRHIRDRSLQHALGEAYRGLLLTGRYPITFLRVEMPPEAVDVNVHPTKLEVRFADSGRIYSQLLGTLRTRFLTTDLTAKFHPVGMEETEGSVVGHDVERAAQVRDEFVRWAKGELARQESPAAAAGLLTAEAAADDSFANLPSLSAEQGSLELDYGSSRRALELVRLDRPASDIAAAHEMAPRSSAGLTTVPPAHTSSAVQIHNRYLITESQEGVLVIDQHALHERILYEQIREKVLAGEMETQRLLVPEPVHLTAAECAAVLEGREVLAQLGIEVEHFGGDSVLVLSYPAMLANLRPEEMLRQMIDHLLSGGKSPDRRDVLDELLHMISCKAAIKAGDRLSPEEIHALLELREQYEDSHHCPHGRPTSLIFTREELDRRFKRI